MEQINLMQAKGGQGTSVLACSLALAAAGEGRYVRLDGQDRGELAAVLGVRGDGPVISRLYLGASDEASPDLVCFDGPAEAGTNLLVLRPCYLALRQALNSGATGGAAGIVLVTEPARALRADVVAAVTGLPVIATVPFRADIARAVDAGVLADRLPDVLRTAARQVLAVLGAAGKEVA